ncbi:MAG: hypothetical protein ACK5L3_05975 [Oscillospiraceae bacterium]
MKRTILVVLLLAILLGVGALYWVDLSAYTDHATGFTRLGSVWARYGVLLFALAACCGCIALVGPGAVGAMRHKSRALSLVFCLAGVAGGFYGGLFFYGGLQQLSVFEMVTGALYLWYGIWLLLAARQFWRQNKPSPTKSAFWGLLAAMPLCIQTIYRVLSKPASLYRMAPLIRIFSALFAMLWFGMLLRALYIAMVRRRAQWMCVCGMAAFLFGLLEFLQLLYSALYQGTDLQSLAEAANALVAGVLAACVSVSILNQREAKQPGVPFGVDLFSEESPAGAPPPGIGL